jgi:hypothetical protein
MALLVDNLNLTSKARSFRLDVLELHIHGHSPKKGFCFARLRELYLMDE